MLTKMLELAKERAEAPAAAAPASSDSGDYDGPAFNVLTFNAISSVGLERFPKGRYAISGDGSSFGAEPMAIMLRSHKLQESDVDPSVRGIVRCGAGTNNCNVPKMTELGIPVFNTPGANANAVKELVICALLLASRGIYEGITHVENVILPEEKMEDEKIAKRIEADKKMFVGNEIAGKTIGVVGLGQIGARVVEAALALGMNVIGYDPVLSVDAAMRLPGDRMTRVTDLKELYAGSDYISLHVPYIPGVTHHLIDAEALEACKPGVSFLNFARGEIVDGEALKKFWDAGKGGKYISDFSDPFLNGHPKHVVLPHLGASTAEAEENSAAMAADTIMNFLETGDVVNSVNFPTTITGSREGHARLCVVHENSPGVLGQLTTKLGDKGYNITQQINNSRGDIAYTVIDLQENPEDPDALQQEIAGSIPEVISMRFLSDVFENKMGSPGTYFYVRWA
uniref:phosphoglycerate dehydrogenase n=1 Tax=Prasinoderma singulare TaxID=676789 RepID=A0A7S3F6X0_9VIRI